MNTQNNFLKFQYLYTLLKHRKIVRYAEYDNYNHCYYEISNCISIPIQQNNHHISISLRDAQTGELLHTIHEEKDFKNGIVEINNPYTKITLHFKSGYFYTFHI